MLPSHAADVTELAISHPMMLDVQISTHLNRKLAVDVDILSEKWVVPSP